MGNQRRHVVVLALLASLVRKTGGRTDATDAYAAADVASGTGKSDHRPASINFRGI